MNHTKPYQPYQPKTKDELKQAIRDYENGKHKERGVPNNWDVKLITDMSQLFYCNRTFNEPITNWDTTNVTNMSYMFACASKFNQPLKCNKPKCWAFIFTQYGVVNDSRKITGRRLIIKLPRFLVRTILFWAFGKDIGNFDTSQVTNMNSMFQEAISFNQPIGQWNTSQVTSMGRMFCNAHSFNQPIGQWDTSQVTDMRSMFMKANSFNQPIGQWNTNQVSDKSLMFFKASSMTNQKPTKN